jgi:hypothetical protein
MISGHDHQAGALDTSSDHEPRPLATDETERQPRLGPDHRAWLRRRVPVALGVLLYVAVLHLVYRQLIAPAYGYSGLGYRAPELWGYIAMVLWTVLVGVLLPLRLVKPSDFLIWMLFCLAGAPSILLCQYNDHMPRAAALPAGLTVGAAMLVLSFGAQARLPEALQPRLAALRRRTVGSRQVPWSPGAVWVGLLAVALVMQLILVLTSGITLSWLNVYDDVYSVRSDFAEFYGRIPLLGYLVPVTINIVNPVLIARGLLTRRYAWFLVGAVGQYTLYVATGTKMTLFSIPALVGVFLLFRARRSLPGVALLTAVVGAIVASVSVGRLLSTPVAVDLIVRRLLIVPGALTAGYIEVFRGQPMTYFADSPLRWLTSPYQEVSPPFLVGAQFVGDPGTSANVSLFGHGYLALGFAGILIEAAALVPVLWLLDRAARGLPFQVVALVMFLPALALSSATVFTTTLTHGLLAGAIVLAVLPRTGWTPMPRNRRGSGLKRRLARRGGRGGESG